MKPSEENRKWTDALMSPEWLWRYLMIAGGVIMLYMQSKYVTRAEYVVDRKETQEALSGISRAISGMQTSLELLRQNSSLLIDHETRLRVLEHERH